MFIATPPSLDDIAERIGGGAMIEAFEAPAQVIERDRYLHWDKLRWLDPPRTLTTEQWWVRVKLARIDQFRELPLVDAEGERFSYTLPDLILRQLLMIDQRVAGEVAMDEVVTSERDSRQRYLVNSLMEEAIRSSQLEGAMTSRVVAKDLLRSGRSPRNRGERMIANNYRALQFMRDAMGETLTPAKVLELHRILTEETLDDPTAAGRLQTAGEPRVRVYDRDDGEPIHVPPPAEELPARLRALCDFANEGEDAERFVHPVLRAILLHFWLAYDHPFVDGNGRTARILFFWAMRTRGYWLAEYLPISRLLRKAPGRYVRAFMETETDGGDTTYFLIHQLSVIVQAIDDLHTYLQRKIEQTRDVESLLRGDVALNGRQLALLTDAVRRGDAVYTFDSHAASHRVSHETARADLHGLVDRELLTRRRSGHRYVFSPAPDIDAKLRGADD
jgi:Fic family protein